jgi:hypothetical protein
MHRANWAILDLLLATNRQRLVMFVMDRSNQLTRVFLSYQVGRPKQSKSAGFGWTYSPHMYPI